MNRKTKAYIKLFGRSLQGIADVLEALDEDDFEAFLNDEEEDEDNEEEDEVFGRMKDEVQSDKGTMTKAEAKKILGVGAKANKEVVEKRYKFLVKMCHPDRFQDKTDKSMAEKEMAKYNEAYERLTK